MYAGVPTATPVAVIRVSPATARAIPKSVTSGRPLARSMRMLWGFILRRDAAPFSGVGEAVANIPQHRSNAVGRPRAFAYQPSAHALAVHQRHDEIHHS